MALIDFVLIPHWVQRRCDWHHHELLDQSSAGIINFIAATPSGESLSRRRAPRAAAPPRVLGGARAGRRQKDGQYPGTSDGVSTHCCSRTVQVPPGRYIAVAVALLVQYLGSLPYSYSRVRVPILRMSSSKSSRDPTAALLTRKRGRSIQNTWPAIAHAILGNSFHLGRRMHRCRVLTRDARRQFTPGVRDGVTADAAAGA